MKKQMHRLLSLMLSLVLVVGLISGTMIAHAASVIDEIHISGVTMPVAGAMPVNSATTSTPGVKVGEDTFWVRYIPETNELSDTYDDNTFVDSTPFSSGMKYSLQVILEPQEGYTVATDVKIFYNGIQLSAPDASDLSKSCAMVHPEGTMVMALIGAEASEPAVYTVTFDSDGGSAVDPQTVVEGKSATKPVDPAKDGYTFKGWTVDSVLYDFDTVVTGDITLKAAWEEKLTASVIDEIHISGVTMPVVGEMPVNSATTSTPGVKVGADTFWVRYIPETNELSDTYDDSTFVDSTPFRFGIKYSIQVILESKDGCTVAADAKIFYNGVQLPAPAASDLSKSCAMVHPEGTMVIALIGAETVASETYTVTFDTDGGSAVTAQTVEAGQKATKPADPTKDGFTFKGWTLNGSDYDFGTAVTGDITLKAKWEAADPIEYSIKISLNGYLTGANVADAYVSESSETVALYDFNDDGAFFCIFEDDGTGQSDWESTVTQFEANKDYWLVIALTKQNGDALPEAELDADNATLINGCVEKYSVYDDDLWWIEFKLNRLSEALPDVYTITFDANGGSVTPKSATTGNDGKLTSLPTPTHTSPYVTFDGWYTGKTGDIKVTADTVFTSNTTIYARWNADYFIEVTLNGYESGKNAADTTLTENSDTVDIDRENCHIFTEKDGKPDWSSEVAVLEANKDYWLVIALTKQGGEELTDVDLTADDVDLTNDYTAELLDYDDGLWWVSYKLKPLSDSVPATYTVNFDANGGSAVSAQTIEEGGKATKPADPTKEGFDFVGWTFEGTEWNFDNTVNGDMTLVAVWTEKEVTPPAGDNGGDDITDPDENDNPQTGDSGMIAVLAVMMSVSALTFLLIFKKRRTF